MPTPVTRRPSGSPASTASGVRWSRIEQPGSLELQPTGYAGGPGASANRSRNARSRHHPRWRDACPRRPHSGHRYARAKSKRLAGADTQIVDAGGRVVMPGFVDAHTHAVFAGTRAAEYEQRTQGATYAEIAAAGGGIRSTVRQTRTASRRRTAAVGAADIASGSCAAAPPPSKPSRAMASRWRPK